MKYLRIFTALSIMYMISVFAVPVNAVGVKEMNIWIDNAKYEYRAGIAEVKVNVEAFIPFGAAEGTLYYDPDLLTFKEAQCSRQRLEFSQHESEENRGAIKICCYGKTQMEQPENICFIFIADTSYQGTSSFTLEDRVLCDSDCNTMEPDDDPPVELKFQKGSAAYNPLEDHYMQYKYKENDASPTEPDSKSDSGIISQTQKSDSQKNDRDIIYLEKNSGCGRDVIVYGMIAFLTVGAIIYGFIRTVRKHK